MRDSGRRGQSCIIAATRRMWSGYKNAFDCVKALYDTTIRKTSRSLTSPMLIITCRRWASTVELRAGNQAEIPSNECSAIIRTAAVEDVESTMRDLAQTDTIPRFS